MNFSDYKATLNEKLSKLTDSELRSLESRFREGKEHDAADTCSAILLNRRNRPLEAKDEYCPRPKTGFTDENPFQWA